MKNARQFRLTQKKIEALKPKERRFTVADGRGLEMEVQPSGVKSWLYRYRVHGQPAKVTIGRWPALSLSAARAQRDRLAAVVHAGEDPSTERRRARKQASKGMTVKEFGAFYMAQVVDKKRKSPKAVLRYLERDVYPELGAIPVHLVTREDVRRLVFAKRDSGRPMAALALRNLLKRLIDYATVCDVADKNPVLGIPAKYVAEARSRRRVLSEAELGLFLRRLEAAQLRPEVRGALRLILLTMTRKSEALRMRWEHVNLFRLEWEIPSEHAKNGMGQLVYLSRQARELLEAACGRPAGSYCVFPAIGSWEPMDPSTLNVALKRVRGDMAHFTVHDLRRTAATRLREMGFDSDWIEKCLNHVKQGVRGIYDRAEHADSRRAMMQDWADKLDELAQL